MNGDAPKARELAPEELATILAWIDGELGLEAATEFELRLGADPELAARVEELSRLDEFVRRKSPARARSRPWTARGRWGIGGAIAAAAALVVLAVLPRFLEPRGPAFEVALAPSFALAEDWTQQSTELAGARAPGIAVARGENPALLAPEEFLRRSAEAESAVVAQALAAGRRELEAGWFVVPIELSAPAAVVVLGLGPASAPLRLFPSPDATPTSADLARLAAGRTLLPGPRAVLSRSGRTVEYQPGFLVPRGTQELLVLVGVREAGIDAEELAEIDAWLATERSHDVAEARLVESGFRVKRLAVHEPR